STSSRRRRRIALALGTAAVTLVLVLVACTGDDPAPFSTTPDAADSATASLDASTANSPDVAATDAGAMCDGGVVDLESDDMNCGACGRGCAGGTCADGVSQPVTIADHVAHPYGLAVAGGSVLWIRAEDDAGAIERCPVTGCSDAGPS